MTNRPTSFDPPTGIDPAESALFAAPTFSDEPAPVGFEAWGPTLGDLDNPGGDMTPLDLARVMTFFTLVGHASWRDGDHGRLPFLRETDAQKLDPWLPPNAKQVDEHLCRLGLDLSRISVWPQDTETLLLCGMGAKALAEVFPEASMNHDFYARFLCEFKAPEGQNWPHLVGVRMTTRDQTDAPGPDIDPDTTHTWDAWDINRQGGWDLSDRQPQNPGQTLGLLRMMLLHSATPGSPRLDMPGAMNVLALLAPYKRMAYEFFRCYASRLHQNQLEHIEHAAMSPPATPESKEAQRARESQERDEFRQSFNNSITVRALAENLGGSSDKAHHYRFGGTHSGSLKVFHSGDGEKWSKSGGWVGGYGSILNRTHSGGEHGAFQILANLLYCHGDIIQGTGHVTEEELKPFKAIKSWIDQFEDPTKAQSLSEHFQIIQATTEFAKNRYVNQLTAGGPKSVTLEVYDPPLLTPSALPMVQDYLHHRGIPRWLIDTCVERGTVKAGAPRYKKDGRIVDHSSHGWPQNTDFNDPENVWAIFLAEHPEYADLRAIQRKGDTAKQRAKGSKDGLGGFLCYVPGLFGDTITSQRTTLVACEASVDCLSYVAIHPDAAAQSLSGVKISQAKNLALEILGRVEKGQEQLSFGLALDHDLAGHTGNLLFAEQMIIELGQQLGSREAGERAFYRHIDHGHLQVFMLSRFLLEDRFHQKNLTPFYLELPHVQETGSPFKKNRDFNANDGRTLFEREIAKSPVAALALRQLKNNGLFFNRNVAPKPLVLEKTPPKDLESMAAEAARILKSDPCSFFKLIVSNDSEQRLKEVAFFMLLRNHLTESEWKKMSSTEMGRIINVDPPNIKDWNDALLHLRNSPATAHEIDECPAPELIRAALEKEKAIKAKAQSRSPETITSSRPKASANPKADKAETKAPNPLSPNEAVEPVSMAAVDTHRRDATESFMAAFDDSFGGADFEDLMKQVKSAKAPVAGFDSDDLILQSRGPQPVDRMRMPAKVS